MTKDPNYIEFLKYQISLLYDTLFSQKTQNLFSTTTSFECENIISSLKDIHPYFVDYNTHMNFALLAMEWMGTFLFKKNQIPFLQSILNEIEKREISPPIHQALMGLEKALLLFQLLFIILFLKIFIKR